MEFLAPVLFALAVSADGFMVGIAYGIRKIRIPVLSLVVVSIASALAVTVSMICGRALAYFLSPEMASYLGAGLIITIGGYFLLQAGREIICSLEYNEEVPLISLEIKSLGIIINILKEPSSADLDCSGEISLREAFFLGVALAMDALGAGVGIAMAGYNILFTAISVGMLKFILVNSGLILGRIVQSERFKNFSSLAAGLILIAIGIAELM